MTKLASALYLGTVMHRRLRPKRHKLRYTVFNILFDLDELENLDRNFRWFSHNRFNLLSFYDCDHGDGHLPLRDYVEDILRRHGLDLGGGPIRLFCMPRVLGYVFNPLSIYFCYRPDGMLAATLYEVNNTFGERHSYMIPVSTGGVASQGAEKRFHVSPFLPLNLRYRFRIAPPGENASVSVHVHDDIGLLLAASLTARRMELTNGALLKTFVTLPLLPLKVVAGIHWEALKLWLKGVKVYFKPEPPRRKVTLGAEERNEAKRNVIAGTGDRAA